jgi:hypothetical protein
MNLQNMNQNTNPYQNSNLYQKLNQKLNQYNYDKLVVIMRQPNKDSPS